MKLPVLLLLFFLLDLPSNARAAAPAVPVPLRVNDWEIGEADAVPAETPEAFRVTRAGLTAALGELLLPEKLAVLSAAPDWLTLADLETLGYRARYLVNEIELRLEIPESHFRREKLLLLGALGGRQRGELLGPADRSFFLNFRAQQGFDRPDAVGKNLNGPVTGDYDLALRFDDVVLESFGATEEGARDWHQRLDTRLVLDREDTGRRWILGDLSYPVTGYQGFLPTLGLGVTKDSTLTPDQVAYSQSETEIVLRRWARVEIWINGALYQSLRLRPGRFSLQSLPLNKGLNRVQVRILDDAGETTVKEFPFLSDNQLLAAGVNQYSYNVGVKAQVGARGKEYDEGLKRGSFYHRYGVSGNVTLGVNGQGAEGIDLVGLEALTASSAGFFSFEASGARPGPYPRAHAGRLRYRSYELFAARALYAGFGVEAKERGFTRGPAGLTPPYEPYPWTYEAFVGGRLHGDVRATLGGSLARRRETLHPDTGLPLEDAVSAYATFGVPLRPNLQLGLELSSTRGASVPDDRATLQLSWFDTKSPAQLFVSHVSEGKGTRAQASYEPRAGARFHANASGQGDARDTEIGFGHLGRRALVGVEARQLFEPGGAFSSVTNQQRWHLASALGWVDGRWFLSRPVSDSVALLEAEPALRGRLIRVNAADDEDDGDFLTGARVTLPELQSYRENPVRLTNEDPLSTDQIEREDFRLRPRYKSAFLLPVKARSVLVVRAPLTDAAGAPRALIAGETVQEGRTVGAFFTDRAGVTHLEGLGAGPAELRFNDGRLKTMSFVVPADRRGTWDVGAWKIMEE